MESHGAGHKKFGRLTGKMANAITRSTNFTAVAPDGFIHNLGVERERIRELNNNIRELRRRKHDMNLRQM